MTCGPGSTARSEGQFESVDPLPADPQVPVTLDPYQYAGNMPTDVRDPSGQGWTFPLDAGNYYGDYIEESSIGGQASYFFGSQIAQAQQGYLDSVWRRTSSTASSSVLSDAGQYGFWIPVLKENASKSCWHTQAALRASTYAADVVDLKDGEYWDIERADAPRNGFTAKVNQIIRDAKVFGMLWPSWKCNYDYVNMESPDCSGSIVHADLRPGDDFPPKAGTQFATLTTLDGDPAVNIRLGRSPGSFLQAWQLQPGVIVFTQNLNQTVCEKSPTLCALNAISGDILNGADELSQAAGWLEEAIHGNEASTRQWYNSSSGGSHILAFLWASGIDAPALIADNFFIMPVKQCTARDTGPLGCADAALVVSTSLVGGPILRYVGSKVVSPTVAGLRSIIGAIADQGMRHWEFLDAAGTFVKEATAASRQKLTEAFQRLSRESETGDQSETPCVGACRGTNQTCFPAGTLVQTDHGSVAIEDLKVGDKVLAENPATKQVEAEPVQALIVKPVSPLLALHLSDGSTIKVTANHPFFVDTGPGSKHADWVEAGKLRVGDTLRTEAGKDVTILAIDEHAGYAVVYTLTVAADHDYFVGLARVLVHNAYCGANIIHQNAAIGEYQGYQYATNDLGQMGVKAPGAVTAPGPDFITYDPVKDQVVAWDAKYRGPGGRYASSMPAGKLARWLPDVRAAVNALPQGTLRDKALNALNNGSYTGQIYPYLK